MEEEYIRLYGELISAFSEWCGIFVKGSCSHIWTDGQELNFVRKKISDAQNKMTAAGFWIPPDFAALPPEMDVSYMKYVKIYGELVSAFSEWCRMFIKGSGSPTWTDGLKLNYVRKKILKAQDKMTAAGYRVPPDFAALPPEMDIKYMRDREKIETEAKKALKVLLESEDYKYIKENQQFLGNIQLAFKTVKPEEALKPVRLLLEAVENEDFPAMRRYADVGHVQKLLKVCRAEMEEEVEDMNPF